MNKSLISINQLNFLYSKSNNFNFFIWSNNKLKEMMNGLISNTNL